MAKLSHVFGPTAVVPLAALQPISTLLPLMSRKRTSPPVKCHQELGQRVAPSLKTQYLTKKEKNSLFNNLYITPLQTRTEHVGLLQLMGEKT